MQQFLALLTEEVQKAFQAAGYDAALGKVSVSGRPDLCEYQCNGAMAGAKQYHKAPFVIAGEVAEKLAGSPVFGKAEVVKPGFLNLDVDPAFLQTYLEKMRQEDNVKRIAERTGTVHTFGAEQAARPRTVIIDYGGPNVAKPLHVGHLRSAVIGEAIKRILRFQGDQAIGDIHLGDWGLQMGLVITELQHREPDLPYFDPAHKGPYPEEAPFTVSDLEEIYPYASKRSKEDEAYHQEALENTHRLQEGDPGLRALWKHIIHVSVTDMKRNYENLNVSFELWNGESTVNDLIPVMVRKLRDEGYAYESQGALVVDVSEPTDPKEVPPCMILKSDGAALYTTTDLATIMMREQQNHPDEIIYVVDKRQELHFVQTFRAARKCGLVNKDCRLTFDGFGTVNGKDGKPYKTRDGGVMRLETLINDINQVMLDKIQANPDIQGEEAQKTARQVGLAAIKYGDLSNQASKDYIFDIDKFTSFEGNTGPYILYTIVRIRSILHRYQAEGGKAPALLALNAPQSSTEKNLMRELAGFSGMMADACAEIAPHRICGYIYQLSNDFNSFYHETRIMSEPDEAKKEGWLALLKLTEDVLNTCCSVLGFEAPERM